MKEKVLILGSNPASGKGFPHKNTTMNRIARWAERLEVPYDFANVIPYHVDKEDPKLVDQSRILGITKTYKHILTLGNFSHHTLEKLNITHYPLPHPSSRNRKFNDKNFEEDTLKKLIASKYLS